jgi:hypothetical protein
MGGAPNKDSSTTNIMLKNLEFIENGPNDWPIWPIH